MATRKRTKKVPAKKKKASKKKPTARARKKTTAPRKKRAKAEAAATEPDSDWLRIALTFPAAGGKPGPVALGTAITREVVAELAPDAVTMEQSIAQLTRAGFQVTSRGRLSVSARVRRDDYERLLGTKLSTFHLDQSAARNCQARSFYFPAAGAPWKPDRNIRKLIDDAYIQWPHIYLNQAFPAAPPSPIPPRVSYHHLRVPGDVNALLNVAPVHREGTTGKGVKVAMVDSGFATGHQYFQEMGYRMTSVLAPGATNVTEDRNGHGTGESANLLATAPDASFVGVKLDNDNFSSQGATILEGFQTALDLNPQVISVSLGYDLCPFNPITGGRSSNMHLTSLPNSLRALEVEVEQAVADGIVVVFSAGNGHVAFPGMMPDVISVGGTFVSETGAMEASDYASAFDSKIYPGRHVPDFCGLVGEAANGASYIMLPVQPGAELDQLSDGTSANDGWGVFSGTSASAPQIAGICALLLQKDPGLTPADIKSLLRGSARDVVDGVSNAASNQNDGPIPAGVGHDGATGAGLVDAFEAWKQV